MGGDHAPQEVVQGALHYARQEPRDQIILMNLCGRGDKDVFTVAAAMGEKL